MGLTLLDDKKDSVKLGVPAFRPDILHPCDIAEEIGIGYGFNNIPFIPPATNTVGGYIPENKFTDLLRREMAQAGFIECLTFGLVSQKENYTNLRYEVDLNEAITLSNPKTIEFEQVRSSLLPGLLKTLQSNQNEKMPQKIFEISDCAVLDPTTDTGARNVRRICVA